MDFISYSKFFSKKYTVDDNGQPLEHADVILLEADLQIQTNAVTMGDFSGQNFTLAVGDIVNYRSPGGVNLREIFVKNTVGAAVGYIVVMGVLA